LLFKTIATVNLGNSGGPALNMYGKVIGTVFAKPVELRFGFFSIFLSRVQAKTIRDA
jgi:hypothetical protein